jgi:Cys-rich four helix bundle protein (predicted Tat secretion target)
MSTDNRLQRREVIVGLMGIATTAAVATGHAETTDSTVHAEHMQKDAPPRASLTPAARALISSTADCLATGRVCLARCTDHLAAGMRDMAQCQRSVMNMLSVVAAMGDIATYAHAELADAMSLATTCARFCDECAEQCEPHVAHHEECKACRDACLECAKACRTFAT